MNQVDACPTGILVERGLSSCCRGGIPHLPLAGRAALRCAVARWAVSPDAGVRVIDQRRRNHVSTEGARDTARPLLDARPLQPVVLLG